MTTETKYKYVIRDRRTKTILCVADTYDEAMTELLQLNDQYSEQMEFEFPEGSLGFKNMAMSPRANDKPNLEIATLTDTAIMNYLFLTINQLSNRN